MSQPTLRAQRKCAQFLSYCLSIGWDRSCLDDIERIFWLYRDEQTGELISPQPAPAQEVP